MHKVKLLLALLIAATGPGGIMGRSYAADPVFRCKDPAGKVVYQQAPCSGSANGGEVDVQSIAPTRTPGENGDQRYLTMLVNEAVSQRDYERARRLAVTPEHWDIIAKARQRELDAKAAAAQPQVIVAPLQPQIRTPTTTSCIRLGYTMSCSSY